MQRHTPTPWVYYPDHYMIRTDETFINARIDIAATSCGNGKEHANAAFIVRACNAHDDLLAAARLGLTTIQATKDELALDGVYEENIAIIEAAIAKAEGK